MLVISWEVIMSHITKISALTRVVIVLHFYPNVCNRKSNQCASTWHITKISFMLGGANIHIQHLIHFELKAFAVTQNWESSKGLNSAPERIGSKICCSLLKWPEQCNQKIGSQICCLLLGRSQRGLQLQLVWGRIPPCHQTDFINLFAALCFLMFFLFKFNKKILLLGL